MRKNIILILLILVLTGCSSKYNIYFDDKIIKDEIEIYEDSKKVNTAKENEISEVNEYILDWERGYDYYKRDLYTTDKITGYKYTYDFTYDEYNAMTELRKCYDTFEFKNSNTIELKTSDYFLCGDYYPIAKDITINISSKYKIESSNADSTKGNTHTWKINKNNYKNKPIIIKINKNTDYKEKENKEINFKKILITVFFFTLVIVLIIRKKRQK